MILYLSASTDLEDLVIDYIEVKLVTGETVSLNWDESDIERLDTGFHARYKGVYFDEEYANIVIKEMIFEDAGEQYDLEHLLPYVTSMKGCEMS